MAESQFSDTQACATSVYFITLGCAKNEVDTLDMKKSLLAEGFHIADGIDECDAVVVNTCSFIQPAIEESIDAFFEVADADCIKKRGIPVIVAGCMPARFGDELESELVEAAAFVPCSKEADIAEVVAECTQGRAVAAADAPQCSKATGENAEWRGPEGSFAYVKISDGCDRFCSYCTIPYIRGRYHSFPYQHIENDVADAIAGGAKEIVLIGQDTGLWGSDLGPEDDLSSLLSRLAAKFEDTWFRAMYTQPENVTDELLRTLASFPNIAPYLDIPLQHCVPRLLKAMNRTGSKEDFLALASKARATVPGIALRTTLIAGFPGETDEDFDELVGFVEEAAFDYVGVFAYSREEGTAAFSMDEQVDEDEKQYRAERLRTVADAVSSAAVALRAGTDYPILVEAEEEDGQLFGRAIVQAPEVDGVTYVDCGQPGSFVEGTVEDTLMYDMEASCR